MQVVELPKISLEEAQKAIQQEKEKRGNAFIAEYNSLCKKYNCEIVQMGLTVNAR